MEREELDFSKFAEFITLNYDLQELIEVLQVIYADYAERVIESEDGDPKIANNLFALRGLTSALKTI